MSASALKLKALVDTLDEKGAAELLQFARKLARERGTAAEDRRDVGRAELAALRSVLKAATALLNAVDDAMVSPREAASWARTGDMRGYIKDMVRALDAVPKVYRRR